VVTTYRRLTALALVLLLGLTACASSGGSGSGGSGGSGASGGTEGSGGTEPAAGGAAGGSEAAAAGETPSAKLATVLTRSGFAAVFGENQQAGVELAVKDLADEGVAELELVASEDAGESNSTALNAYRRAVSQDPAVLIGPIVGTMVLAMRPDLERDEVPLVTTAATRSLTLDDNTWVYRNFPHSGMSASANARFAFEELGIERPAILADNTAFGQDDAAVLVEEAESRGIDVVANESVDPEAVDVTGQVSRIVSADADAVFVQLLTGSPLAEAIRSLRGGGFEGTIFAAPGLTSPSTLQLLSDADVEGVYTPGLVLDRSKPEVQAYVDAFNQEYGREPDIFSAVMYDTVRMIGEAVAGGATSAEQVSEALSSSTYEGMTAELQADEEGNLVHTVNVLQFDAAKKPAPVASFDIEFTPRDG
jgi:branched-chain amino acid transport system substrate-binding protein